MTTVYKINIKDANVWAKLENQNPTGTHKDRSMAPWISHYMKQGIKEFAIASSGNSALAAVAYCTKNNLKLTIFVSPDSPALPRLRRGRAELHVSRTPRRDAIRFCIKNKMIKNLRASTDDLALIGYKKIAFELIKQLPRIDNIFIPTSSGATLEGIYSGFQNPPALFCIQTAKVHPIASYFDKNFKKEKTSYASAIVDSIAHRRDAVIKICKETGGGGFVVSNKELEEAKEFLERAGWHSALAFAGLLKWRRQNPRQAKREISVCLFTD